MQPVREAIRAHGAALERVVVERQKDAPQLDALARFASDQGAKVERVPRSELDRLAKGARHQGAIAFAPELAFAAVEDVARAPDALVVALDELEDPQNFGAIVRSAVAMGASAVVWPEHHSAPLSPATFRASAGAVEHATLCRVPSLPEALAAFEGAGLAIVGLDASAELGISAIDLREPTVLVVGAEGKGLRKSVKRACRTLARLPMKGPVASLNASVSAAIALYEARRQRAT
jgi:23S rRNA (guanosine2251-2'-O)-methyltransferase